jgi:hypothetical protein
MPLKSGDFVTWLRKYDCQLLGTALDLQIDALGVYGVACPAEYVPSLVDKAEAEAGLPADHIPVSSFRSRRRRST